MYPRCLQSIPHYSVCLELLALNEMAVLHQDGGDDAVG
jgi:hypothetical protein